MTDLKTIKTALISVYHKEGLNEIINKLNKLGIKIISTGGTKSFIEKQGYKVVSTYKEINLNDPDDQSVDYFDKYKEDFVNWFKAEINATEQIKPDIVVTASGLLGPHTYFATKVPIISIINTQYLPESRGILGISLTEDTLKNKLLRKIVRPLFEKKFIEIY